MPKISINVSNEEIKILEKRSKKNFLSLREQIEDIIRRSTIRGGKGPRRIRVDDRLVDIFSREKRGRRKKPKSKKSIMNKK